MPNYKQVDILPAYTFGLRRETPVTRYIQESGVWFPQSSERWYSYSPITGTLRASLKMNAADCSLFLRENKMNPDHKKGASSVPQSFFDSFVRTSKMEWPDRPPKNFHYFSSVGQAKRWDMMVLVDEGSLDSGRMDAKERFVDVYVKAMKPVSKNETPKPDRPVNSATRTD